MVISHKYRFIFIKTVKTAGTSIEAYLSTLCGPDDIFTPIHPPIPEHQPRNYRGIWNPVREIQEFGIRITSPEFLRMLKMLRYRKRYYNHIVARKVRARTRSKIWDDYFKFCVERNPWDKTISHFNMLKYRVDRNLTLEKYFENGNFCYNRHRYTDRKGNPIVDKVVKFENLSEELGTIFGKLGVPYKGALGINAKGQIRSDKRPYQKMINQIQQRIIGEAFKEEIDMHGYKF